MKKIRAIVYGVGMQGKLLTKYIVEKGIQIVGAIDTNLDLVDKDLGEVAGLGYPLNVKIANDADVVLSEQDADIALVSIFTEMETMYPIFERCIENDLNVITTSEETLYAWGTAPVFASKLDKLAKEHGVTITGSGLQHNFRVNLVTVLTGACQRIELILGKQTTDLSDRTTTVLTLYHVGEKKEEFDKAMKEKVTKFSTFRISSEALIDDLGLTIARIKESVEATIDDEDTMVKGLGRIVPKGDVTGMKKIFEADTEQGIHFRGEQIAKVFGKKELNERRGSYNEWFIKGVPDLHLVIDNIQLGPVSCSQIVNLIPDVINSEPGYMTVEKFPILRYKAFPLQHYLRDFKS